MQLTVRHFDCKHFTVLHGDSQCLFAGKRLHTDQSPFTGFYRLCIDLRNLLLRQVCAVLTRQSPVLLDLTNCRVRLNLADINELRATEIH